MATYKGKKLIAGSNAPIVVSNLMLGDLKSNTAKIQKTVISSGQYIICDGVTKLYPKGTVDQNLYYENNLLDFMEINYPDNVDNSKVITMPEIHENDRHKKVSNNFGESLVFEDGRLKFFSNIEGFDNLTVVTYPVPFISQPLIYPVNYEGSEKAFYTQLDVVGTFYGAQANNSTNNLIEYNTRSNIEDPTSKIVSTAYGYWKEYIPRYQYMCVKYAAVPSTRSAGNSYGIVKVDDILIPSTEPNDKLTLIAGKGITLTPNIADKSIEIESESGESITVPLLIVDSLEELLDHPNPKDGQHALIDTTTTTTTISTRSMPNMFSRSTRSMNFETMPIIGTAVPYEYKIFFMEYDGSDYRGKLQKELFKRTVIGTSGGRPIHRTVQVGEVFSVDSTRHYFRKDIGSTNLNNKITLGYFKYANVFFGYFYHKFSLSIANDYQASNGVAIYVDCPIPRNYYRGERVFYEGKYYRANQDVPKNTKAPDIKWTEIGLDKLEDDILGIVNADYSIVVNLDGKDIIISKEHPYLIKTEGILHFDYKDGWRRPTISEFESIAVLLNERNPEYIRGEWTLGCIITGRIRPFIERGLRLEDNVTLPSTVDSCYYEYPNDTDSNTVNNTTKGGALILPAGKPANYTPVDINLLPNKYYGALFLVKDYLIETDPLDPTLVDRIRIENRDHKNWFRLYGLDISNNSLIYEITKIEDSPNLKCSIGGYTSTFTINSSEEYGYFTQLNAWRTLNPLNTDDKLSTFGYSAKFSDDSFYEIVFDKGIPIDKLCVSGLFTTDTLESTSLINVKFFNGNNILYDEDVAFLENEGEGTLVDPTEPPDPDSKPPLEAPGRVFMYSTELSEWVIINSTTGSQGIQGERGEDGKDGKQGVKGDTGPQGIPGEGGDGTGTGTYEVESLIYDEKTKELVLKDSNNSKFTADLSSITGDGGSGGIGTGSGIQVDIVTTASNQKKEIFHPEDKDFKNINVELYKFFPGPNPITSETNITTNAFKYNNEKIKDNIDGGINLICVNNLIGDKSINLSELDYEDWKII